MNKRIKKKKSTKGDKKIVILPFNIYEKQFDSKKSMELLFDEFKEALEIKRFDKNTKAKLSKLLDSVVKHHKSLMAAHVSLPNILISVINSIAFSKSVSYSKVIANKDAALFIDDLKELLK